MIKGVTLITLAFINLMFFIKADMAFAQATTSPHFLTPNTNHQNINIFDCNGILNSSSDATQLFMPERGIYFVLMKKENYYSKLENGLDQFKEDLKRNGYYSFQKVGNSDVSWSRLSFNSTTLPDGSFQITIQDPVELINAEILFGPKPDTHVPRALLQFVEKLNKTR